MIEAQHRGALDHALRQLAGNLSRPLEAHRGELLDLLADVEAGLDFVDEDIQFIDDKDLIARLRSIEGSVGATRRQLALRGNDHAETVIALRGLPNAGKSRLLNQLVGKDAAIVADVAGTTRDVVSVTADWGGRNLRFLDTAGIEEYGGDSPLERISNLAQEHARRAGEEARIRLWCVDQSSPDAAKTRAELESISQQKRRGVIDLWVATKCDQALEPAPPTWLETSSLSGSGIETLRQHLLKTIDEQNQNESQSVVGTAARCEGSLMAAEKALGAAINFVVRQDGHEYVSAELRIAADALGEVTGIVYTDDILDRVFSRFCIGK